MRGHEAILSMRRCGVTPASVWIDDTGGPFTGMSHPGTGWQVDTAQAQVEVLPTDNPRRLDLRFAAGLTVHLHTDRAERLQAFEETAQACGVGRFLGNLFAGSGHNRRVVRMTDTAGAFVFEEDGHGQDAA